MKRHLAIACVLIAGCKQADSTATTTPADHGEPQLLGRIMPREVHFAEMQQLTFGGENAEAYWSFDGTQLVFQSRPTGEGCDQIFRLRPDDPSSVTRVSNGQGVTTCSYFLPGDQHVVYASTHLGGAACPPKPDRSQGYVWPLYDSYDIFKASVAGGPVVQLTAEPGYDAEATVCPKDGSIVFTSVRDGDLELYRMTADGSDIKRLTHTKGYDGGAFFNIDCSKIVWRASRPTGEALADYQRLLAQGLVRPTKLEIFVANADGSDARQVTYLDAASFGPYWFPNRERIIFSTNYGDPKGREFEMWAVDADGTDLERITYSPGFDGFPMFSHDGARLAFSSNRATAPGAHDTNVFVVQWDGSDHRGGHQPTAADRVHADIAWLADPARDGRGIGTPGLATAGAWIEKRFGELGVAPAVAGRFRQSFEVPLAVHIDEATELTIDELALSRNDYQPLSGSASGAVDAQVVFAGYGIDAADAGIDDYAGVDAKGKVVLVRRFVPASVSDTGDKRRYSSLRYKAWTARDHGAAALLVVDAPPDRGPAGAGAQPLPAEAPFPALRVEGYGDAGIPMMIVNRSVGTKLLDALAKGRSVDADLRVALKRRTTTAFNVVGKLTANASNPLDGAVVIGAHYDHLGHGGPGSLAPDSDAPHLGADDNASGVAALLEVGRRLAAAERARDVWLIAFSAEESGVLGSNHFVHNMPVPLKASDIRAMLNMDMVGRMRENRLKAIGGGSAAEWPAIVGAACRQAAVQCDTGGDGYGPSDQTSFYAAGVPVLHWFTGAHSDYHKPSDTVATINAAGTAKVAEIVADVARAVMTRPAALSYQRIATPPPAGDLRSYGASLGSIPDYSGPRDGSKGVLLQGVRPGGAADLAQIRRGDILVKLSRFDIANVRDLMYALRASKPGQTVKAVVLRDGRRIEVSVTFQPSSRRHR